MEATHTESQGSTARSFDLDAMGLGPPTKVRRRGKIDKWTRILGVAVVLLLVFNIGVRLGHASRPKAATPAGGAGAAGAGAGAGARGGAGGAGGAGAAGAGTGADAGFKPVASGTVKVIDGNSIYVSQPDGTTKKIVSNESTRYTRTEPSTQRDVQPGDQLSVEGTAQPDGTVTANRVTDRASTLQQP